jgi:serine/threonine-protein kinase
MLAVGDIFKNRYKIVSLIGEGGMGKVFYAEDQRIEGKYWAIKEVKNSRIDEGEFIREAKVLAKLNHPYLPKIIDYYFEKELNRSYLVMDSIKGNSLQSITETGKVLPEIKIIKYGLQLCDLFNYLHNDLKEPIVYRDLKPNHVLIDEQDNIKLIDFGIAKEYILGQEYDSEQLGTVRYAAPEQFNSSRIDHRSDLYSLGALFYYLFSRGKHYYSVRKPLQHLRNDLPTIIYTIINKLLMSEPENRYQNITDVIQELEIAKIYYQDRTELLTTNSIQEEIIKSEEDINLNLGNVTSQIMVCSLSKRAGSTFITTNLAKFISEQSIVPNVVEIPFSPYLFDYLGIERLSSLLKEESSFYSVVNELYEKRPLIKERRYSAKGILWTLVDPRRPLIKEEDWDEMMMLNLLYSARKSNLSLIDVGNYIEHPAIVNTVKNVDYLIVVIDPILINIAQNLRRLSKFCELAKGGVKVKLVLNNWTESLPKRELIKLFDFAPVHFCPNIALPIVHRAAYNGDILYEYTDVSNMLKVTLNEIASDIVVLQRGRTNNSQQKNKYSFLRR